jgi:hypothetical protein
MEAVRTSETWVDNHFTWQYIPEDNSEHLNLILLLHFAIHSLTTDYPKILSNIVFHLPFPSKQLISKMFPIKIQCVVLVSTLLAYMFSLLDFTNS